MARVNQNVAKKKPSCGLVREWMSVPGWRLKRATIVIVMTVKRQRLRMKITVPNVARPEMRPGTTERTNATPPVDVVEAYQAKVKCLRRSRRETLSDLLSPSSSSMEESPTSFSAFIRLTSSSLPFGKGCCISLEMWGYAIVESAKALAVCRYTATELTGETVRDFL